jgi:hypothetical protein
VDASQTRQFKLSMRAASPVVRQERHYFFLFLPLSLSEKERSATTRLPKDINNVNIPMNILNISYAVTVTTSLLYVLFY